jgi:hypothetical protein
MSLADIMLLAVTGLYFALGGAFIYKGNLALAVVYSAYGVANVGLFWASLIMDKGIR